MPKVDYDYLIVGLGIAGACLWHELRKLGQTVLVADAADTDAASRVAPGVINPLAGKKLNPSWKVDEQLPQAIATYEAFEQHLGGRYLEHFPIIRIIKDATQRGFFEKRLEDPEARPYIGQEFAPGRWPGLFRDPYGSFESASSGYLRVGALCSALRTHLKEEGGLLEERVEYIDLDGGQAAWKGLRFGSVVFCEGWRGHANQWFKGIPFRSAKGEMLTLRCEGDVSGFPQAIVNRSKWVLPLGDGLFRAGSTYSWDPLNGEPTPSYGQEILSALAEFVERRFTVVDHQAGVRPIVRDFRPVLGRHPEHPALAIFNGLGSKGVLAAPWLAVQLAAHLHSGTPLEREISYSRFLGR